MGSSKNLKKKQNKTHKHTPSLTQSPQFKPLCNTAPFQVLIENQNIEKIHLYGRSQLTFSEAQNT